ncbi:MAG: AmmeMemoRadiSam system radical SAM enzyme [Bacteroidota bacterium]|nr:AmmeMemoRadiSam system radical SAM enzyme [Bacteroidota bacterium]
MQKAKFYTKLENKKVQCLLCPHNCIIANGEIGICNVRKNIKGELYSENYRKTCSLSFDPIEKKPLYHFYPGNIIFSVGSIGCNLKCKFCQNWEISQTKVSDFNYLQNYSPTEIIEKSKQNKNNIGIAFTYNEPTVWYEFMLEIAKESKKIDLKNVVVTNGFINEKPLEELLNFTDAFNIDLKAFNNNFYKQQTEAKLEPVLKNIKAISKKGKHIELTNLIIPTLNDDEKEFREMLKWIANETGQDTVLHLSRYFPNHKMNIPPTPENKLLQLYEIAKEYLNFVYLGNISTSKGQNTYCPNCGELLIKRTGYSTFIKNLNKNGKCKYCKEEVVKLN